MFRHSLVDSFVVATNKDQMIFIGQLLRYCLIKAASDRRHKNPPGAIGPNGFHRSEDRFRFHYHTRSAAIRWFIGQSMLAGCPIANVQAANLDEPILLRFSENTFGECALAQFRKEREDVELQHD